MTLVKTTRQYDPTARTTTPPTPTLASLVRLGLLELGQELRVAMPCRVVAVRSNYRVDLQPLFQSQFFAEKDATTPRVLPKVPVQMPGGVNWQVKYPIDVGDVGLAIFADRALDAFMAGTGEPAPPGDARTHHMTDAIYVPGLAYDAMAQARQEATDDLVMRNGTAEVRLERDGQFRIYSGGANNLELVDLIGQLAAHSEKLVQVLQAALVATALGPAPFLASTLTQLNQAYATVQLIRQSLDKLKGS